MPTPFIDFDLRRDAFDIDGYFPMVEPLLIKFSTDIHGTFQIESVRRLEADDSAVPAPAFISDYIASWARTQSGKLAIQAAYEEALPSRPLHDEDHPDNAAPLWRSMRAA